MRSCGAAIALVVLLGTGRVYAQKPPSEEPEFMRKPVLSHRRQGFMIGAVGGMTLFDGTATPRSYLLRDTAHEIGFGPKLSPSLGFFIGDAPSDHIALSLQLEPSFARDGNLRRKGTTVTFRFDVFPLLSYGGVWRDVGISPHFGAGSLTFSDTRTNATVAESGLFSLVGADLVWDALRVGGLGVGPTLGYSYRWSDTLSESAIMGAVRVVFYAGP